MSINEAIAQEVKSSFTEILPDLKRLVSEAIRESNKPENITPHFTPEGAAKYLNTTRQSLATYVKNGVVKCYRLNGCPRFKKSDLDAALIPIEVKPLQKHK